MKTIESIQEEIESIASEVPTSRTKNRIAVLRQNILYLETGVSAESIREQLQEQQRLLKKINRGYSAWQAAGNGIGKKNPIGAYHSEMGSSDIRRKIKNLKYILED